MSKNRSSTIAEMEYGCRELDLTNPPSCAAVKATGVDGKMQKAIQIEGQNSKAHHGTGQVTLRGSYEQTSPLQGTLLNRNFPPTLTRQILNGV